MALASIFRSPTSMRHEGRTKPARFPLRILALLTILVSLILNTITTHTFRYHPAHFLTSSAYLPVRPPLPSLHPSPQLLILISNTPPALPLAAMAPPRHLRPVENLDTRYRGEPPDRGVCVAVCGGDGHGRAAALLVWVGDCGEDRADDVGCGVVVGVGVSVPLGVRSFGLLLGRGASRFGRGLTLR